MSPERNARIAALLNDPRLWTLRDLAAVATVPTGHPVLDAQLPGGGWPVGAITEVMAEHPGIGEVTLIAPALARLSAGGQRLALIAPPYRACAPGWSQAGIRLEQLLLVEPPRAADALWACEQILRSSVHGAVLLWASALGERELRRLQLAAEQGGSMLFLFRPTAAARDASPAALRLRLAAGLRIDILKSRGGQPRTVVLPLDRLADDGAASAAPTPRPRRAVMSLVSRREFPLQRAEP